MITNEIKIEKGTIRTFLFLTEYKGEAISEGMWIHEKIMQYYHIGCCFDWVYGMWKQ